MPRSRFQPKQWAKWIEDHSVSNLSLGDQCARIHSFFSACMRRISSTARSSAASRPGTGLTSI